MCGEHLWWETDLADTRCLPRLRVQQVYAVLLKRNQCASGRGPTRGWVGEYLQRAINWNSLSSVLSEAKKSMCHPYP